MKKLLMVLAIGAFVASCNNNAETASDATQKIDSVVNHVDSTVNAIADSAKAAIDTTIKATVDSLKK